MVYHDSLYFLNLDFGEQNVFCFHERNFGDSHPECDTPKKQEFRTGLIQQPYDRWCCYLFGNMDPINIPPPHVSIYTGTMDPMEYVLDCNPAYIAVCPDIGFEEDLWFH